MFEHTIIIALSLAGSVFGMEQNDKTKHEHYSIGSRIRVNMNGVQWGEAYYKPILITTFNLKGRSSLVPLLVVGYIGGSAMAKSLCYLTWYGIDKIKQIKKFGQNPPTVTEKHSSSEVKNMYKIVVDYAPAEADNAVVREGIIAFNEKVVGEREKEFSIFLKNDLGHIFGGIQAFLGIESIYIDTLWVEKSLQKQGYGTKLLNAAEREAIKNGCSFSLVDTWDFQAEEFYLKNGYERIGELKNYWHGHTKIFLRKNLRHSSKEI